MAKTEFLYEQEYWDDVAGMALTLRATTGKGLNLADAPGFYQPTLQQIANLDRTMWEDDQAFGSGKMSLGEITLVAAPLDPNAARPYDFLIANRCSTSRRPGVLLAGPSDATSYAQFTAFMGGSSDGFSFSGDGSTVTFRWRDGIADLIEDTAQLNQYAGTGGAEGGSDIQGQWKQRVVPGYIKNVPLLCVDTTLFIYQVSDGSVVNEARWKVKIKGSNITQGSSQASYAALAGATVGANTWDYTIGSGGTFVRFSGAPSGEVTSDVVVGTLAADRTVAQAFKRLLLDWGVSSGAISSADVSTLDGVQTAEVSYAMGNAPERRREVLDKIVGSAGAIYWKDPNQVWRIKRVEPPSGSPVATFRWIGGSSQVSQSGDLNLVGLAPALPSSSNGEPVKSTTIRYAWNPKVQTKDALAGVALSDLQFLSMDWRTTTPATDAAIAADYKGARVLVEDLYFQDATAAATERDRRKTLRGSFRRWFALTAMLDAVSMAALQDLAVVKVYAPMYGLDAGQLFLLVRAQYDSKSLLGQFLVWG